MKKAFTLTEIVIVAAIIGILAAIIIPEFQTYAQQAKEAAAKDNLRIVRTAIERYAIDHNGIPPGYQDGDPTNPPGSTAFGMQLVANDYLSNIPENPFNKLAIVQVLGDEEDFPAEPFLTNLYGWIYKPATKTIRLNWSGIDSGGVAYYDY